MSETTTVRIPYGSLLTLRRFKRAGASDGEAMAHVVKHARMCPSIGEYGDVGTVAPQANESDESAPLSLKERLTTKKIRVDTDTAEHIAKRKSAESSTANAVAHVTAHYAVCERTNDTAPPAVGEPEVPAFLTNRAGPEHRYNRRAAKAKPGPNRGSK